MKIWRNRRFMRAFIALTLITLFSDLAAPIVSYGLTSGPHQPEYTSYESGASDMVNLLTGDFVYSNPLIEVPGPEGGFNMALGYHAGIGPDQEASWVGLGWTLNPGAITRSVVEFPDDANGENQVITVKDLTGVRGWTSSILVFGQIGWNSQVGHYGSISLGSLVNISYDNNGISSVGVAGINVSSEGVSLDAMTIVSTAMTIASIGSAAGAVKAATSEAGKAAAQLSLDKVLRSTGASIAFDQGMVALSSALEGGVPNAPNSGYWKYSKRTQQRFLHKNYWIWLDQTRYEDMYGVLNLDKATTANYANNDHWADLSLNINSTGSTLQEFTKPASNKGAASDISYYLPSGQQYYDVTSPAVLAPDFYQVNAFSISGSIQPYRLDIGSVSMPRQMTALHNRLAPLKYSNYKVPFIYTGSPFNSHYYHAGGASSVSSPTSYLGISHTLGNSDPFLNTSLAYNMNDVIFGSTARVRSDLSSTKKIPQGNHIEWVSNDDIKNTTAEFANGFMDYFSGQARIDFRSDHGYGGNKTFYSSSSTFVSGAIQLTNPTDLDYFEVNDNVTLTLRIFNDYASQQSGNNPVINTYNNVPVNSKNSGSMTVIVSASQFYSAVNGKFVDIEVVSARQVKTPGSVAGYVITDASGTSYHFAIPIYDYDSYSYIEDKDYSTKNTTIQKKEPFANTWLLTGVTGPDFVDRGGSGGAGNGIIDDSDWGYWVRLNYGKYTDSYQWRMPYTGMTLDAANTSKTYSQGYKQLYYLNSIETRSHIAVFMKETRSDNLGKNSAVSLRLGEVALLSKEVFKKLTDPTGSGGYGLSTCIGTTSKTWWLSDFFQTSGTPTTAGQYMVDNCVRRTRFTYNYDLCPSTPNSSSGKLTLQRISLYARKNAKTVPDYVFEYSNNYSYNQEHWDGWGMYNPGATPTSRPASTSDASGAAWSLTKIKTPIGSEVQISYERDTYSSVSGNMALQPGIGYNKTNYTLPYYGAASLGDVPVTPGTQIAVNDHVWISGTVDYSCPNISPPPSTYSNFKIYSGEYVVTAVNSNSINVSADYMGLGNCVQSSGTLYTIYSNAGNVQVISMKGGNIRVSSLLLKDPVGVQYKTRYLYNNDNGVTSGVVASEPEFIRIPAPVYQSIPGYPTTPVMYGKVTVLAGKLTTDADYTTKQVYEFETPHQSMIQNNQNLVLNKSLIALNNNPPFYYGKSDFLTEVHNTITDSTSKIGSLKSSKTYDKNGTLVSSSTLTYSNQLLNSGGANNYQGIYSEGTLMFDRVDNGNLRYHKATRTTVFKYPYTLQKTTNQKDGLTSESENIAYDFITGKVIETKSVSPLGLRIKSVTVPAYSKYAELGSKATDITYRNMLSQDAANYTYKLNSSGTITGLVSASVQTWKKDWSNYRVYNTSTSSYSDGSEGKAIWRKYKTYAWKGSYSKLTPNNDGTQTFTTPDDEFNFNSGATNSYWQYLGEEKRFDHYSMPLESKGFDSLYSSTKMGYDGKTKIAEAGNARYNEIAFSGAEDKIADKPFFGGEVGLGSGTIVYKSLGQTNQVHSGDAALSLASPNYGFVYKPTGLITNKIYRAIVWTNSTNGRIYYKLNGGSETLSAAPVGSVVIGATNPMTWYRIIFEIPIGSTFTSLEVGVKSTSGTILFDDFRFQPFDAGMTCYVYNPVTKNLEFVLDNDNLYTQYEYNDRDLLTKTYRESFKFNGVKLISEVKDNYKRFVVDP